MTSPYRECPRFQKCSVNNCPLNSKYPEMIIDLEDMEQKCSLEKQIRFRIGSQYPDILKFQGLTPKEWAGRQRFENLSDKDKEAIRQRAKLLVSSSCQKQNNAPICLEGVENE